MTYALERRSGMTLIEVLVSLVLFSFVIAGTAQFFIAQSGMFRRGSQDMALVQNVRFGADLLHSHIRIAGSRVTAGQPQVVFADEHSFAFNADYASNVDNDAYAVYVDPDAPLGQVMALTPGKAITLPGSSYTYPTEAYLSADGLPSPAETIVFFFEADTSSDRPDDYMLLRRANDAAPEVLMRNVLPTPGVPFFRYHVFHKDADGVQTLQTLGAARLPLEFAGDGEPSMLDSLRAVEINMRVSNGEIGAAERTRDLTLIIPLPHLGRRKLDVCGSQPLSSGPVNAVAFPDGTGYAVTLTWTPSTDETSGEQDIVRYVVWKRIAADPDWSDPFLSIPAGSPSYLFQDTNVEANTQYEYAVSAQDCTPKLSTAVMSNTVFVPNF
jgi:prepilin-type N-terminal cleavage/methylation domain-containing protein